MYTLREARPEDRQAVVDVWDESGITQEWNDPPTDFDLAMESPGSTVLVAESPQGVVDGATIVGFDGHRGWIHMTGVRPNARGGGVGRLLSDGCVDWLRERKAPAVHLMVAEGNDAGRAFWEHLGYFKIEPPVYMISLAD